MVDIVKKALRLKPRKPELVQKVIRLRRKGLSWRKIGPLLGLSHQAPYLLYKRWEHWEKEYKDASS